MARRGSGRRWDKEGREVGQGGEWERAGARRGVGWRWGKVGSEREVGTRKEGEVSGGKERSGSKEEGRGQGARGLKVENT